eukprot:scaffold122021_cov63-Phaeocystis_antarctica.AAC.3
MTPRDRLDNLVLVHPRVVLELDPDLAAPCVETVERVELRQPELCLVGATGRESVAAQRAAEQRHVTAHGRLGRGIGEGFDRHHGGGHHVEGGVFDEARARLGWAGLAQCWHCHRPAHHLDGVKLRGLPVLVPLTGGDGHQAGHVRQQLLARLVGAVGVGRERADAVQPPLILRTHAHEDRVAAHLVVCRAPQ